MLYSINYIFGCLFLYLLYYIFVLDQTERRALPPLSLSVLLAASSSVF